MTNDIGSRCLTETTFFSNSSTVFMGFVIMPALHNDIYEFALYNNDLLRRFPVCIIPDFGIG